MGTASGRAGGGVSENTGLKWWDGDVVARWCERRGGKRARWQPALRRGQWLLVCVSTSGVIGCGGDGVIEGDSVARPSAETGYVDRGQPVGLRDDDGFRIGDVPSDFRIVDYDRSEDALVPSIRVTRAGATVFRHDRGEEIGSVVTGSGLVKLEDSSRGTLLVTFWNAGHTRR